MTKVWGKRVFLGVRRPESCLSSVTSLVTWKKKNNDLSGPSFPRLLSTLPNIRICSNHFTCVIYFNPFNSLWGGYFFIPILQIRELRLRATNNSSEGARLSKGLGCELRPSGPRRLDWLLSWFKRPERQALGLLCSPRVSSARGRQHGGVTQGVFAGRRKEKREGGNHETGPDSLAFSYPQLDQGLFKTERAEAGFLGRRWSRNTLVKFRCVWELIILRMSKKKSYGDHLG